MDSATAVPQRSCPFPGLRPFRDNEHALFFGRSKEIEELYAKLTGVGRFLTVIGTSGCGYDTAKLVAMPEP